MQQFNMLRCGHKRQPRRLEWDHQGHTQVEKFGLIVVIDVIYYGAGQLRKYYTQYYFQNYRQDRL